MNKILSNLPETITTKRLILQMPRAGFGKLLNEAITDGYEDYVEWLNWPSVMPTEEETEIECRKHHAEFITREFIRYLIIEKKSQKVVGRCAFPSFQANWLIPQFSISYFVSRKYRARGYATEATRVMVILAFEELQAKKVEIFCDDQNIASCYVAQKLGFSLEYSAKGGRPRKDGTLAELQCYSLFSRSRLKCL